MLAGSKTIGGSTVRARCWILFLLTQLTGCSLFDLPHPPPLPRELSPEGVRARVVAPVTLDSVDKAPPVVSLERPKPLGPPTDRPESNRKSEPPTAPAGAGQLFLLPQ